jgi:AraC-like DNA-binding protein
MEIKTAYPLNPLLKKHIEYYYFLKTDSPDFQSNYHFFPNTTHALNIHKNIEVDISEKSVKINGKSGTTQFTTILQGKYEEPILAQLHGRLDKVTIVFKPLGICHFLADAFGDIAQRHTQLFTSWDSDPTYHGMLCAFFEAPEMNDRVELLEQFLTKKFRQFNEYDLLNSALSTLQDFESNVSVEEISHQLHISERTLNRMFTKHVGISLASYRKIARFRHSMNNKLFAGQFKKLTEIGYESNFYDQAYFSKMYKKITGENPNQFFKSIDQLADNNLVFRFVKE